MPIFPTWYTNWTPATDDRIMFSDTSASNQTKDCAISELPISIATQTALDTKVDNVIAWTNTTVSRSGNTIKVNSIWWPAVVTDWFNRNYFVATEWQTEFTANFDFTENTWSVIVALNWQILKPTLDYTEPWLNKVVFVSWLNAWDEVQLLTGIKWDKGDKWDNGDKWDKGDKWDQGIQWIQWEKWDKWDQWIQWIQWLKGDKWDKWDAWTNGIDGIDWTDWRWIVSITLTSWDHSPWTLDTYTITYTDATTSTFQVYNWADWTWTLPTSWLLTYSAINSSQAITNWNYYWVTCTGDIILTLADWTSSGQNLSIKKLDNTAYTITITGNIEWETSIVIDTQYESLDLFWNWTYYLIK